MNPMGKVPMLAFPRLSVERESKTYAGMDENGT